MDRHAHIYTSIRQAVHDAVAGAMKDEKERDPDEFYPIPNRAEKRRRLRAFHTPGWKKSCRLRKKRKPRTGGWK
ncbi:Uncharacterised protein [Mycobacteroides abscessus subsp. abscessus]|nr:Uncharacterised protein [Mycobacteroides abscessus subsp. abscessus]